MNPTPQQLAYAEGISRQVVNRITTQQEAVAHLVQRYGLTQGEAVALFLRGDAQRAARPPGRVPGPRTLLSQDRGEIAEALLGHGLDEEYVRELLDLAGLEGDAQSAWVRVAFDGVTRFADLFPVLQEAA